MDASNTDVTIIGGGPAGLTLAAELASRGIQCCVIEQHLTRSPQSRAFGLSPLTLQLLDMRGVAQDMLAHGHRCHFAPLGDGKGRLQFSRLKTHFQFLLSIYQEKTEEILEQWALSCGASIIQGANFTKIHKNEDSVIVSYQKDGVETRIESQYLVACDGVYGKVGKMAGIQFSHIKYAEALMHADVHLKNPPADKMYARITRAGMVSVFPHNNDTYRMIVLDQERMHVPADQELSLEEFKQSAAKLSSIDFGIHDPLWLTRFSGQQKHALSYRRNRILLAGDAAHTHMPAGGQGLQVAVQDAFNLGWKLASVIKQRAPAGLLDSYEKERRMINEESMARSRAFYRYEIGNDNVSVLLKWLINKLVRLPFFHQYALKELSGMSTSYRTLFKRESAQRLSKHVGCFVWDFDIHVDVHGSIHSKRLHELLRSGKIVVLESRFQFVSQSLLQKRFSGEIVYASCEQLKREVAGTCCLVRPDGVIAWVGESLDSLLSSEVLNSMLDSPFSKLTDCVKLGI
jgi:2-polyprenyl-6-methoxyphenol hydroxylase-like FAD-dependent oxidoreductase